MIGCIGTCSFMGKSIMKHKSVVTDFHALRGSSGSLHFSYCFITFQVSVGRVYDAVLVAAEGIKMAMKNGTVLSNSRLYQGFCSSSETQQENASGKELARHLNEVMGLDVNPSPFQASLYTDITPAWYWVGLLLTDTKLYRGGHGFESR